MKTTEELPKKPAALVRHIRNYHRLKRLNEKARIERERESAKVKKTTKTIQEKPEAPVNGQTTHVLWAMHEKKIDDLKLIIFDLEERLIAQEDRAAKKNGR